MQESQFLPQHPHQHQQQHSHPPSSPTVIRSSKTLPTEESQLCDDILSCILALDEVIAEFDDSHSISSPVEPPASISASLISSSPPVPIVSSSSSQANNHSLRLETSTSNIQSNPSLSAASSPTRPVRFPEFHTSSIGSIKLSTSKPDRVMMTSSSTPSQSDSELILRSEICCVKADSENIKSLKGESQMKCSSHVNEEIVEVGECKKESNNNSCARKKSKIPSLKSPSRVLPIISSTQSNSNGASGGGGSFPKVKLRSSNPLLEYRSVKMQNFILPDELPPELIKEHWDFPAGKNLPRSLSKTRETCIVDDDGQSPKAVNPRFIPTKSEARASRIPKLRLDMCNIYEDNHFNLSQHANDKVTSPGSSSSVGGQSPRIIEAMDNNGSGSGSGSGSGCSYDFNTSSGSSSNIPVPKPRRNSPVIQNQNHANSFASVIQSMGSPKGSESMVNSTARINKAVSPSPSAVPLPVQIKEASVSSSRRNHGSRDNSFSENQFQDSFRKKSNGSSAPHNTAHDTDDGYLSMINKTEDCPVLWPEEMIENEIFSDEELRRLSFQCDDRFLSSRGRDPYRLGKSHSSDTGAEKTDYFSDDSLEYENTAEENESFPTIPNVNVKTNNLNKQSNQTSSKVSFSANADFIRGLMLPASELSASAAENRSVTMICIPDAHKPSASPNSGPGAVSPVTVIRKPCSFFVPMESECGGDSQQAHRRKKKSKSAPNHGHEDPAQFLDPPLLLQQANVEVESKQRPQFQSVHLPAHEHETQDQIQNGYHVPANEVVRESVISLEPAQLILEKIENFAEKLALKIERSGSEEAAATLTLQKVEIDIENIQTVTPNATNKKSTTSATTTITHSHEYSPVSIKTQNQPGLVTVNNTVIQEARAEVLSSDIMAFLSENPDGIPFTHLQDVPEEINSSETQPTKKTLTVLGNLTSGTDQHLVDWRFANGAGQDGTGRTEPLDMNTSVGDSPQHPAETDPRWSTKLEDDSASDDLSETPPQFIPEPPPVQSDSPAATVVSPPNQISQKLAANIPPQALQNDSEGWKASSDRNSRSSEDIIQAVNSETLPETSRSRPTASTLPLNTRPPADGRGSFRPIRNILNRFRKSKPKRSNMSLSEERAATLSSSALGSRPQQLNEDDSEGADSTSDANRTNTSTKRRSSSVSSTKKSNIFARIFSRKNK